MYKYVYNKKSQNSTKIRLLEVITYYKRKDRRTRRGSQAGAFRDSYKNATKNSSNAVSADDDDDSAENDDVH